MGQLRNVVPGATYFITRRCYQRTFRLRPSKETNAIYKYCLALAIQKTGVLLHAAVVMSNHHHLVVTDVRGVLPDFLRELHRSIAKAMNALHGHRENLWAAEPCSVIRLMGDDEIIEKIAYIAANPVAAGLVAAPLDWPGVALWEQRSTVVRRPDVYFDKRGRSPSELTLDVLAPLAETTPVGLAQWNERLRLAISAKVAEAHEALRVAARDVLGPAAVLNTSVLARATSLEPRRGIVPPIAASDFSARQQLLASLKAFRDAYRAALRAWTQGARDVVFPWGTWWMRVHHKVECAPPPKIAAVAA